MGNKKLMIIVLSVLAAASFGASFLLSGLVTGGTPAKSVERPPAVEAAMGSLPAAMLVSDVEKMRPKEKDLTRLIKELRYKLEQCQRKEIKLDEREKQISMAEEAIKQDAKDLEKLRMELVVPLTRLKEQITELKLTRILIAKQERDNLRKAAAWYGTMKSDAAAKILQGMDPAEAVKILYYLGTANERAVGKILERMDAKVVEKLTGMLKRIQEQEPAQP